MRLESLFELYEVLTKWHSDASGVIFNPDWGL